MKYCADCGSEYQGETKTCVDCGTSHWLSLEEMQRHHGVPVRSGNDRDNFVLVDTAEDPLMAQQLQGALEREDIPVYARPRHWGTVANITSGTTRPWWDILVPSTEALRAAQLIEATRREFKSTEGEAIRAAEEEAAMSAGLE